jgi:bifunctional DNase/RNase
MKKIELDIVALSHSVSHSQNYAIILGEKAGVRRLPIVIGGFEAQAIAVALERMVPNRPLTHDLFKNTLEAFQIELKEIIISDLVDGIFYAVLICEQNGEVQEIDSRTSDALALAVRYECPIFTYDHIMDSAGVVLEESDEDNPEPPKGTEIKSPLPVGSSLSNYSLEALEKMLEEVLGEEDYEKAAQIRDEINRRTKDS